MATVILQKREAFDFDNMKQRFALQLLFEVAVMRQPYCLDSSGLQLSEVFKTSLNEKGFDTMTKSPRHYYSKENRQGYHFNIIQFNDKFKLI